LPSPQSGAQHGSAGDIAVGSPILDEVGTPGFGQRFRNGPRRVARRERERHMWYVGYGILWIVLAVTLGILTIRKGHWVMFIVGIFLPFFWLIGAIMPPVARR
jgi:hypothetical protein